MVDTTKPTAPRIVSWDPDIDTGSLSAWDPIIDQLRERKDDDWARVERPDGDKLNRELFKKRYPDIQIRTRRGSHMVWMRHRADADPRAAITRDLIANDG